MNINSASENRHAIVIGGSMARLLAARVLADCYEHVTLVERDALAPSPENRRSVPQGRGTRMGCWRVAVELSKHYFRAFPTNWLWLGRCLVTMLATSAGSWREPATSVSRAS